MNRRTFLTALGLGSATIVVSCASDDDASPDGSERATVASSTSVPDVSTPASPLTTDSFGVGVASGDPTPTSVILWTRLLTELTEPVDVKWEVATDAEFTEPVGAGIVPAAP